MFGISSVRSSTSYQKQAATAAAAAAAEVPVSAAAAVAVCVVAAVEAAAAAGVAVAIELALGRCANPVRGLQPARQGAYLSRFCHRQLPGGIRYCLRQNLDR